MDWIEIIQNAISFIENELGNSELSSGIIAKHVHVCESHFSRAFNIITGYTLSMYIRNRRLSIAGEQLKNEESSVSVVAFNVGYDSPEAFSKAFKRFHGVNPSESKIAKLKEFYPMSIKLILTQERPLTYNIKSKSQFYLNGETISVSNSDSNVTAYLWSKCKANGYLEKCCSFPYFETLVGVSIGDCYTIKSKCKQISADTTLIFPPHKWAIFPCYGEMPEAILKTWNQIYTNWMPKVEYEIDDLPQLEVYFGFDSYDSGYSCEIWIPVK